MLKNVFAVKTYHVRNYGDYRDETRAILDRLRYCEVCIFVPELIQRIEELNIGLEITKYSPLIPIMVMKMENYPSINLEIDTYYECGIRGVKIQTVGFCGVVNRRHNRFFIERLVNETIESLTSIEFIKNSVRRQHMR